MRASILCKKLFNWAGVCCCFAFVVLCVVYSFAVKKANVVRMDAKYSFVVKRYENTEVGSFESEQLGGAGYTMRIDGKTCVAVSVYESLSDAESVKETLGEEYSVYTMSSNDLYLLTNKQKLRATVYEGAFASLDGCIQVLSGEIKRLDNGATQQSSKRILSGLQRQFSYLAKNYQTDFPAYSDLCEQAVEELKEQTGDVIYARKLRALLCRLCENYCNLTRRFSP